MYHRVFLSRVLEWIGLCGFVVLLLLYGLRVWLWPEEVAQDFMDGRKVFSFLTLVAACNVLGVRMSLPRPGVVSLILVGMGALAWVLLVYGIFLVTMTHKPWKIHDVNGSWLLLVVSTQSVVSGVLAAATPTPAQLLGIFALWVIGAVFYLLVISVIIWRLFFLPLSVSDVQAPYWINMGATAITVLAGSHLVLALNRAGFVSTELVTSVQAAVFAFWAWGTWWIPILILLGIWKHAIRRAPLDYQPELWSMVFPLGMYSVATTSMAVLPSFRAVHPIGADFLWIGVLSWILVVILAGIKMVRRMHGARPDPSL